MTLSASQSTTSTFYVAGGTLQRDAACYVPRKADTDLFEGLRASQFCYVLTSRQMGKSSLMVRTRERLREQGVAVAVLDLTAIGQNLTPEQWYDGLLGRIGRQLDLEDEVEDFWLDNERLGPLERFLRALREVVLEQAKGNIVIFVDEVDAVRSLAFSADEFFAGIRECYNRRTEDPEMQRLTFCLLGVATPSDLIRDTRTTPFNIGKRIELTDFTPEEAAPLAQGLGARGQGLGEKLLARILYWTGGHPYLTQRLCQALAETVSSSPTPNTQHPTPALVDKLCEELFLSSRARERDDNLLFVRERLLRSEADLAGLLDLYGQVRTGKRVKDDETNALTSLLRLSGITRVVQGMLLVRNRIYYRVFDKAWVQANMPDAELRRQKQAYRRGMGQAMVGYVLIAVMAGTAWGISTLQRKHDIARLQIYYNDVIGNVQTKNMDAIKKAEADRFLTAMYTDRLVCVSGHKEEVRALAFSPDGKRLATATASSTKPDFVQLWDTTTGQISRRSFDLNTYVQWMTFSPNGKRLAIVSKQYGQMASVQIWDLATEQQIGQALQLSADSSRILFHPNGEEIAISLNNTVLLWNATTGQVRELRPLAPASPFSKKGTEDNNVILDTAFCPQGNLLAIVSGRSEEVNQVQIWDTAIGKPLGRPLRQEHSLIVASAFSPDGTQLATASSNGVHLWDVATGNLRQKTADKGAVGLQFSPDGKRLLLIGLYEKQTMNRNVQVWDTTTRQPIGPPFYYRGWIELCRDGRYFANVVGNSVNVWRLPITKQEGHEMELRAWAKTGERVNVQGEIESISALEWAKWREEWRALEAKQAQTHGKR